jgi:hypothetical protein
MLFIDRVQLVEVGQFVSVDRIVAPLTTWFSGTEPLGCETGRGGRLRTEEDA